MDHNYSYNNIGEIFSKRTERLLRSNKISKMEFCQKLNFSQASFSYWRKGRNPRFSTVIKVASFLNCSIDYLLGLKDY